MLACSATVVRLKCSLTHGKAPHPFDNGGLDGHRAPAYAPAMDTDTGMRQ